MVTGFDLFLKEKGFELVAGEMRDLNTYNNCRRTWRKDNGHYISIALYAQPTRICVESTNGLFGVSLPTEGNYNDTLKSLTE